MGTEHERVRDRAPLHPGDFVAKELLARGWTCVDLGNAMCPDDGSADEWHLCADFLLAIRDPHMRLGVVAEGLSRAFGTSAELWTNLDEAYRVAMRGRPEAEWPEPPEEALALLEAVHPDEEEPHG